MEEFWATSAMQDWNKNGVVLRGVFKKNGHKLVAFATVDGDDPQAIERIKQIIREENAYAFAIAERAARYAIRPPFTGTRKQKLQLGRRWAYANKLAHKQISRSNYVHI